MLKKWEEDEEPIKKRDVNQEGTVLKGSSHFKMCKEAEGKHLTVSLKKTKKCKEVAHSPVRPTRSQYPRETEEAKTPKYNKTDNRSSGGSKVETKEAP